MPMGRPAVRVVQCCVAFVVTVALIVGWAGYDRYSRPGPLTQSLTLIIEKGIGVALIADQLATAKVVDNAFIFRIGVRFEGRESMLRAGEYLFPARISMREVAVLLESGNTVKRRLT
ncbi:MAG: endolytic transglycosylase MltG, partial [Proteobacteria bacterium]|nr:endolytic transglycosylase MltG [Pseudomonadota bacterium]